MKLYTFESFINHLTRIFSDIDFNLESDYFHKNLISNDRIPFTPEFVVDLPDDNDRRGNVIFEPQDDYDIKFIDSWHISPDETTAYFKNEDDALMFLLTSN
jgi:hypothetical protein